MSEKRGSPTGILASRWACDLTMETGLAKLRALDAVGLSADEIADIRWCNAARVFGRGAFPRCEAR